MQKTTISYYCDVCGKKIEKVMFTLSYCAAFNYDNEGTFMQSSERDTSTEHLCLKCAAPYIDIFGLHIYETQALLDADESYRKGGKHNA